MSTSKLANMIYDFMFQKVFAYYKASTVCVNVQVVLLLFTGIIYGLFRAGLPWIFIINLKFSFTV